MLKDVGSERSVLASFCQCGSELWAELYGIIEKNTFTQDVNQAIYQCLEQIFKDSDTVDLPTICNFSTLLGLDEIILKDKHGIEYLQSLFNYKVEKANVINAAKIIARLQYARIARDAHKTAFDQLNNITGTESIDDITAISEKPIYDVLLNAGTVKTSGPRLLKESGGELMEWLLSKKIEENIGIPTPWENYNAAIGGMRRGGVTLISAFQKTGKSSIAKECARHCVQHDIPVLYLDTEMDANVQYLRSLASLSQVNIGEIERGDFREDEKKRKAVLDAHELLQKDELFYYEQIYGHSFESVLSLIRRWIVTKVGFTSGTTNNCLVIFDYFKVMGQESLKNLKEYELLGFQVTSLVNTCKEYDFPCLAFIQRNREGGIAQAHRVLWTVDSYSVFSRREPEELREDGEYKLGNRKLVIENTRHGPGIPDDYIIMNLDGATNTITENTLYSKKEEYSKKLEQEDKKEENGFPIDENL
jgi:replicative DNA helicase